MKTGATEFQKALITNAAFLRGQIIGSYAQVEYLLADLAVRCADRPEYEDFSKKFPYKLESRLAAVKKLATIPGPISVYGPEILEIVDTILKYEEIRHFMAHGFLIIKTSKTDHLLHFKLHSVSKGAEISEGVMDTNLEQLGIAGEEIAKYSGKIVRLFYRIYMEQGL